ncbi:hypothetical protein AG1IA_08052 [Rhizoctonia solani AG-1 IA]|uniref:Uncharacterized protein n=1 Tax=Thanatephorus cucumeris (strain AG1-IA) TaxID=983506 RepID=L8WNJ6_THACA|nr:hypothetical protein AG1IA_08052 [Rhizoctonia solani AG-1 IA]
MSEKVKEFVEMPQEFAREGKLVSEINPVSMCRFARQLPSGSVSWVSSGILSNLSIFQCECDLSGLENTSKSYLIASGSVRRLQQQHFSVSSLCRPAFRVLILCFDQRRCIGVYSGWQWWCGDERYQIERASCERTHRLFFPKNPEDKGFREDGSGDARVEEAHSIWLGMRCVWGTRCSSSCCVTGVAHDIGHCTASFSRTTPKCVEIRGRQAQQENALTFFIWQTRTRRILLLEACIK